MGKTILVVDDEKDITELVEVNLRRHGFAVICKHDGATGLKALRQGGVDLVVLDVMMPGMDGWEFCKRLRSDEGTRRLPVVMLTAKGEESDKVLGLELGADDYISKPFSPRELVARVRAVLRRSDEPGPEGRMRFEGLTVDPASYEVRSRGKAVSLTAKEFQLLEFLCRRPHRVVTREVLLDAVWGVDKDMETRTVDVHIRRLRKKLGSAAGHVSTVRGIGYKFLIRPEKTKEDR